MTSPVIFGPASAPIATLYLGDAMDADVFDPPYRINISGGGHYRRAARTVLATRRQNRPPSWTGAVALSTKSAAAIIEALSASSALISIGGPPAVSHASRMASLPSTICDSRARRSYHAPGGTGFRPDDRDLTVSILTPCSAAASGYPSPRRERQAAYSVFIRLLSFTRCRLHMVRNFRRIYRGAPLHKPR